MPDAQAKASTPAFNRTGAGIGNRKGLPAAAYTDRAVFELEQDRVFAREWVCVGIVDDVAQPGDVKEVKCGRTSLILVRDEGGTVRAFHNHCRHRGMRLIKEGSFKCKLLVCPYHAWSYGLDGRLQRAPNIGGPQEHDANSIGVSLPEGLETVRLALWHRLIFVNLSGDAPPFEEHIRPLAERWARYDFSQLRPGGSAAFDAECNWKLAIENFIDVYHVPIVHPALNRYNRANIRYYIHERGLYGQGNPDVLPPDAAYGKMPAFPGLSEKQRGISEALCLYPNLLLTVFCDHLRIIIVEPTAVERSHERVEILVVGEAALAPELAPYRKMLMDRFVSFNSEDLDLIAELQKSMPASHFRKTAFSPYWDGSVICFQDRIQEAVGDAWSSGANSPA